MQLPVFEFRITKLKILVYSIFLILLIITVSLLVAYWRLTRPKESQMGEGIIKIPGLIDETGELLIRGEVKEIGGHILIIEASQRLIKVEIMPEATLFNEKLEIITRGTFEEIKIGQLVTIGGVEEKGIDDYTGDIVFLSQSSIYYLPSD